MVTILLSAGDQSGEAHAAALVRVLRARLPDVRFVGLGGALMRAAGVEIIVDQRELAVGGLFELIPELGRIVGAWRRLSRALAETRPELVVLVDSGGFNLPFAGRVKRTTGANILYFIAPQVWAWRPGRIRRLAARVAATSAMTTATTPKLRRRRLQVVATERAGLPAATTLTLAIWRRAQRSCCRRGGGVFSPASD